MEQQENIRQYLTFCLADEQYGLDVLQVREVLELPRVTRVPRMSSFMKGVINIRGSVVPVIDLRLKLGLAEVLKNVHTRVVIIKVVANEEKIAMGIQVDSVQEVVDISPNEISPTPQIGTQIDADYISGIAKVASGFVILINLGNVFNNQDLGLSNQDSESSTFVDAK